MFGNDEVVRGIGLTNKRRGESGLGRTIFNKLDVYTGKSLCIPRKEDESMPLNIQFACES
jgi:hypothetical protein